MITYEFLSNFKVHTSYFRRVRSLVVHPIFLQKVMKIQKKYSATIEHSYIRTYLTTEITFWTKTYSADAPNRYTARTGQWSEGHTVRTFFSIGSSEERPFMSLTTVAHIG